MRRLVLIALLAGCQGQGDPVLLPAADVAGYQASVHPIMEARCGTLDCHGDPGRPLRLYSETGLRAADELRAQLITEAEIEANARSLLAVDPDPSGRPSLVLSKPLAGMVEHEGKDLWLSATEPQYVCVAGWLEARLDEPAIIAACAEAALEVELPPP